MPVSTMTLLPQPLLADAEHPMTETVRRLVPRGGIATFFSLDDHFLRIDLESADLPQLTSSDNLGRPPAPSILVIELDAADDVPERTAARLLDELDDAVNPLGSAAMETRHHLDITGNGPDPTAHAFIMNTRQRRLTRDEFYWYYRTTHTSLARDLRPAFMRYATHRVLHSRGSHFEDGVTVQEYPSMSDFVDHISRRTRPDDDAFRDISNFVGVVDYWVGETRQRL